MPIPTAILSPHRAVLGGWPWTSEYTAEKGSVTRWAAAGGLQAVLWDDMTKYKAVLTVWLGAGVGHRSLHGICEDLEMEYQSDSEVWNMQLEGLVLVRV